MTSAAAADARADAPPAAERGLGPALDDSFGFLVCDTARQIKRLLSARLAQYGIPGGCWFVLRALWLQDGISQRELSERLGLAEPAVVMTLRSLERLDLVSRERDEVDRRRMRVLLTRRARDLQGELLALAQQVNRDMLAALPAQERTALVSTLRTVRAELMKQGGALPLQPDAEGEGLPAKIVAGAAEPASAGARAARISITETAS